MNFIELQLTRPYNRYRDVYRQGIAGVDAASGTGFAKPFADLSSEEQTEVLAVIEEKDSVLFGLVLAHNMQGFYGEPRHGGNCGEVSWKMLGLPSPPVRGLVPYERKAG